jgi:hypothetical protein
LALKERFGVTLEDLLENDIDRLNGGDSNLMHSLARRGDHATLRILAAHFGFSAEHARSCDNIALRTAAYEGHLSFLEALAGTYGLGAEDARACRNQALRQAVQIDDVGVIRVLFNHFGLDLEDVHERLPDRSQGYYFVWYAMCYNSPRAMQALMAMYNLPGVAERAQEYQERGWWVDQEKMHKFYLWFVAKAVGEFGPEYL